MRHFHPGFPFFYVRYFCVPVVFAPGRKRLVRIAASFPSVIVHYNRELAHPGQAVFSNGDNTGTAPKAEGNTMPGSFRSFALAAALLAVVSPGAEAARDNDYPTVAIADYVFGCMAANGQTRQALEKCSCSIDLIASILPYDRYVSAETVLQMRRVGGEKGSIFRTEMHMTEAVAELRRAQAESEMRCF
jgi:hypothetical protein